ncbi:MAG: 4Fe-4S binding protein [Dehalococcoidia bacterium]
MLGRILKRLVAAPGLIANYGYADGSGSYYITIDTDKCNNCGACVTACPSQVFEIITDDYDDEVAAVRDESKKNIKYACDPCKPVGDRPPLPCVEACEPGAITHSW